MPTTRLLPSLLFLLACAEDPPSEKQLDADGDNWTWKVDCDDSDPAVYPDADERCDGYDNDCDGEIDEDDAIDQPTWYADEDADGYGSLEYAWVICERPAGYVDNSEDCDDLSALSSPDGEEVCDGSDNDCDGVADEPGALDQSVWYRDQDSDGYGDPSTRVGGCAAPEGYVADDTDCNDANPTISPGAHEACDEDDVDEDCDGYADDEDSTADGRETWYLDEDLDGHGVPAGTSLACDQPVGYAPSSDDCQDEDRLINPSAVEICGDGIDNNCDDIVDNDDPDARPVDWYADVDEDTFGDPTSWLGMSCAQPAGAVADDHDCDDSDAAINPDAAETWYDGVDSDCDGAGDFDADMDGWDAEDYGGGDCDDEDPSRSPGDTEICDDGEDNDCDTIVDACTVIAVLEGEVTDDQAGVCVAATGDINGDGLEDIIIGADREDSAGAGAGAAYVMFGPITGDISLSTADAKLLGEALGDHAGLSVDGAGDLNMDGVPDLVIGAYDEDSAATAAGAVYIVNGPVTGELSLGDAEAKLLGEAAGDQAGFIVRGGLDVRGDGYADVLVGAYTESSGGPDAGAAYLLEGPIEGNRRLWTAQAKFVGEEAADQAGWAVSPAGDIDGDGMDDILIGAPNYHADGIYSGAAYLVLGAPRGTIDLSEADGRMTGETSGDQAGYALTGGADINGDGFDDVLVGAPENDRGGNGSGAVYLLYGPFQGELGLGTAGAVLVGENNDDQAGCSVDVGGDFNSDGLADLLVGACLDDAGASDSGAAYMVLSGALTGLYDLSMADGKVLGELEDDQVGASVSHSGDLDGDDVDDILVGAPLFDDADLGYDVGQVWILPGGGWP
jgi:hypothetical protein